MTTTVTLNETVTFTITHARHMAAKVATDLLRFQRFYGRPSNGEIDNYEAELVELLKGGYVDTVTYGLKRNGNWIIAVKYRATSGGDLVADDAPGKIRPGFDDSGAVFTSYLTYSSAWSHLTEDAKEKVRRRLPIRRSSGVEPGVEDGYWAEDLTYSAGGRALRRSIVRKW